MPTVQKPVDHPDFDTVWAALQELTEKQKETDRLLDKNARQMEEYNKRFGDFTRRFGEVVEYMIAPNLCEKFREFDLIFQRSNTSLAVFRLSACKTAVL
jgi:hypothetical protein